MKWQPPDRFKAIRLLGRQPLDIWEDRRVRDIYLACAAMDPGETYVFGDLGNELHLGERRRFLERNTERSAMLEIPEGPEAGKAALLTLVSAEEGRLEEVLATLLERGGTGNGDPGFDDSDTGERLRRHQATCDRSLLRVLEALRKRQQQRDGGGFGTKGRGPARPAKAEAPEPENRIMTLLNLLQAVKAAAAPSGANGPSDPFGCGPGVPAPEMAVGRATAAGSRPSDSGQPGPTEQGTIATNEPHDALRHPYP